LAVFTIADLHLSLGASKPMDIFTGWENYEKRIEKNWRETVSEEDTIIIPGDISWAMSLEQGRPDFAFLHSLPGQKVLMKGNHDYWWNTRSKIEGFFKENGFDSLHILHNSFYETEELALAGSRGWFFDDPQDDSKVLLREAGRLRTSITMAKTSGKEVIAFLHYPPVYNQNECEEIMNVLTENDIRRCYYGHIHGEGSKWAVNGLYKGIDFHLIAGDFIGFCPVIINKL